MDELPMVFILVASWMVVYAVGYRQGHHRMAKYAVREAERVLTKKDLDNLEKP